MKISFFIYTYLVLLESYQLEHVLISKGQMFETTVLLKLCLTKNWKVNWSKPKWQKVPRFTVLSWTFCLPVFLSLSPPKVFCFLLFCPPSLCQQVSPINTELSVTRVTIGSCRYSEVGRHFVYRLQFQKMLSAANTYTHTAFPPHTQIPFFFASSSHSIITDTWKFGLISAGSNQMRKQRITFWLFIL